MALDPYNPNDPNLIGWGNGNALVGYVPEGAGRDANAQPGYGNLPNTLAGWGQLAAAATGAVSLLANPVMAIPALGYSVATGKAPSVSGMTKAASSYLRDLLFGDAAPASDPSGLSAGSVGGGYGSMGGGVLSGMEPNGLTGIGDITGGGDRMSGGSVEPGPDGSKGNEMYATGGYTGGQEGQPAGEVHGQEFVLSAPAVRALGVPFLTALNDHAAAMFDPRNAMDRERMMQSWHANGLVRGR